MEIRLASRVKSVLSDSEYRELIDQLDREAARSLQFPITTALADAFSITVDQLFFIYDAHILNMTNRSLFRIKSHSSQGSFLADVWRTSGRTIADLALRGFSTPRHQHVRLSPWMLCRRILEEMKLYRSDLFVDGAYHAPTRDGGGGGGGGGGDLLEIPEALQSQVLECARIDYHFSPLHYHVLRIYGAEYEQKLLGYVKLLGIPCDTEHDLRKDGAQKTPDLLLKRPFSVKHVREDGSEAWTAVHWIDSKASFGDPETVREKISEQMKAYVARYKEGAVIFWFGYCESIKAAMPGVVVLHEFPSDIVML
eukprot:ANDGO_07000.mRNA.1 hypothetical protein Gasu_20290